MKRIAHQVITYALAGAAMITCATACGTPSATSQQSSTSPSASTTLAAQPTNAAGTQSCTDLGGTVGTDQTCHVKSATPAYTVDISYPSNYPDQQPVKNYLKRDRDEFVAWVEEVGPDGRGRPYEYAVTATTYRSGTADSGTQSLVLHIDSDAGLANQGHPNTTFQSYNYDLGKHTPITFDTLFKPGTEPVEVLNPIVQRELSAPSADLDETKYQNFAITDDAVIFFFGQNQVVQDNNGPHKVTVPRSELASLLA